MRGELPDGDPDGNVETGALWRSDEPHGEGLMRVANHEVEGGYEVEVYHLRDGEVEAHRLTWGDDEMQAFVANDNNAFLSGHNVPGIGEYGVFVDGARPNCPECGVFMSPGVPEYHADAIGFTCPQYDRTHGEHEGYMAQAEAIRVGYYLTIEQYLTRRYGGDSA